MLDYAKTLSVCVGCECDKSFAQPTSNFSVCTFFLADPPTAVSAWSHQLPKKPDVTGWTVLPSFCVALKIPSYTGHLLLIHTISTSTVMGPYIFIELKMKILAPDTSAKRVCSQKIRLLKLISDAMIEPYSIRSRSISFGEIGIPRRLFRCAVMRVWRIMRQNGVPKGERGLRGSTRLICGKVMSVGSIVMSDFLQKS